MKDETIADEKQDFYLLEKLDDLAIIRLGKNFFFEAIALAVNNPLLDAFDHILKNDEVKEIQFKLNIWKDRISGDLAR